MLLNTECSNAKTSVLIVDMENSNSEMIEKLGEVSRDTQYGQNLERQPLSSPSRMTFKNSRGFVRSIHAMRRSDIGA